MADTSWTAYTTEDGEPWAAFVAGHVDIRAIAATAEDEILRAFSDHDEEILLEARSLIAESGGVVLTQFWLTPAEGDEEMFFFAKEGEEGAFPVTGMRFA